MEAIYLPLISTPVLQKQGNRRYTMGPTNPPSLLMWWGNCRGRCDARRLIFSLPVSWAWDPWTWF
jgi:hypothetical protein